MDCPRITKENSEKKILSPFAARAAESRGRSLPEIPCEVRTDYERDIGRIIYSEAFRRLRHKTQVFFNPLNDHVCTRMEHVMYVSYIADIIGSSLGLNHDLITAIAYGHDIGHTPFGHSGERVLSRYLQAAGLPAFHHELQSLRQLDYFAEHNGQHGLNLTFEVRDGVVSHCGESYEERVLLPYKAKTEAELAASGRLHLPPATMEGCVVRFADRIAYVGRDIEDAERSGILTFAQLPSEVSQELGTRNGEIVNSLVQDIIRNSFQRPEIVMSEAKAEALQKLTQFNIERIYSAASVRRYEKEAENTMDGVYDYFCQLWQHNVPLFAAFLQSDKQQDRPETWQEANCDPTLRSPYQTHLSERLYRVNMPFCHYLQNYPLKALGEDAAKIASERVGVRVITDYIAGMTDGFARRTYEAIYQI